MSISVDLFLDVNPIYEKTEAPNIPDIAVFLEELQYLVYIEASEVPLLMPRPHGMAHLKPALARGRRAA
jgi:hypothetical protein